MPIPFASIPEHVKLSIVEKQSVHDFVVFQKCSLESYDISKKVKTRFTLVLRGSNTFLSSQEIKGDYYFPMMLKYTMHHIYSSDLSNAPIRLKFKKLYVNGFFSTEKCAWLTNIVMTTGSTIKSLSLSSIECPPANLNELLMTAGVQEFWASRDNSLDYFRIPAMKQMTRVIFFYARNLNDQDFLSLDLKSVCIWRDHNITTTGINTFLKQWQKCKRYFTNLSINMNPDMLMNEILDGITYVTVENTHPPRYELKNDKNEVIIVYFNTDKPYEGTCDLELGRWIYSDRKRDGESDYDSDDDFEDDD